MPAPNQATRRNESPGGRSRRKACNSAAENRGGLERTPSDPQGPTRRQPAPRGRKRSYLTVGGLASLISLTVLGALPARAANTDQLMQLLGQGSCPKCKLQDADLVHASLRDANLKGAQLQRANLSGAQLDGAQLGGADLSFTSLQGASLRGADLRGARLEGTDLRESDLSGALLDPGALSRSHWDHAKGIADGSLGYAELHNAGVEAALSGNAPAAERLFGDALLQRPDAALTWLARGISRKEQGKTDQAVRDFRYASELFAHQGDAATAKQLTEAALAMEKPAKNPRGGNGAGVQMLSGAAGIVQALAPIALKLLPLAF